jgi:uncharacterized protein (TIGR02145 family)
MRAQLITRKGRVSLPIFTAALTLALALTACDEKKSEIGSTFTDSRDGKAYKTVKIGSQTWMAENLNYKTGNSWCYANSPAGCGKYGRLYDWNTAKAACPIGWHLSSREEWNVLVATAGGKDIAGKKLKAKNGWADYEGKDVNGIKSGNGTDDFGFAALPGGLRISDNDFDIAEVHGGWWTSTEYSSSSNAYYRYMENYYEFVNESNNSKSAGYSVRCVRD